MERFGKERHCVGIFSLRAEIGSVEVPLPDGEYENRIGGNLVRVEGGRVFCDGTPLLLVEER